MLRRIDAQHSFSLAEARALVADLFEPKAWIYWVDFLVSDAIAFGSLLAMNYLLLFTEFSAGQAVLWAGLYVACGLAAYRASLFTHELSHLRSDSFKAFRVAWNVGFGIPLLMPSFLYHTHLSHHSRREFGTADDGEYLPFAYGSRWNWIMMLGEPFVLPLIALGRFLILAPLSWMIPPFRRWLMRHASSMVVAPTYVRPEPSAAELRWWRIQEVACFVAALGTVMAVATGRIPVIVIVQTYSIAFFVLMINAIRSLGAHRYRYGYEPSTFQEQVLDSVNFPHNWLLGPLWAPVGLRYHATHHLFPSMPYHALGEAHRRLMTQLPADHPYRQTEAPGLWSVIFDIWTARNRREAEPAGRDVAPSRSNRVPTQAF
ncbi:MAG: fatty acid desaturase [Pirellulales bacterium]|nr:fatty acid desaturase [Pirellulales bacterium]